MLVAGGAGGVGEAIVRTMLDAGHHVIVPSRTEPRLARLRADVATRERPGILTTLIGDIGTLDGARALRDRVVAEHERVDVLVPSLGGWWEGALRDVTIDAWDAVMHEMLRTHFIFAHVFLPVLRAQAGEGRYLGIGGGAAYHPISNASLVSIAAASQLMMTRALRLENDDPRIDILELVADGPVRTRDSAALAAPSWIDANDVARIALELAEYGSTVDPSTQTAGAIVRMRPTQWAQTV